MKREELFQYVRRYKLRSVLLRTFVVTLILLVLPLLAVNWFVYRYNEPTIRDEIGRASLNELTKVRDTVDMIVSDAESMSLRIGSDPDIGLLLQEPLVRPLGYPDLDRIQRIQQIFSTSRVTNSYLYTIQLYSFRGQYVLSSDEGTPYEPNKFPLLAKQEELIGAGKRDWTMLHPDESGAGRPLLLGLYRLLPYADWTQTRGLLAMYIDFDKFDALLRSDVQRQNIYIVDEQGRYVYHADRQAIGRKAEIGYVKDSADGGPPYRIMRQDGQAVVVANVVSGSNPSWRYVSVVALNEYQAQREHFRKLMAIWLALSVAASVLVAVAISLRSYRPIRRILSLFDSAEPAAHAAVTPAASKDWNEIKQIMSSIDRGFMHKRAMEEQLEEKYRKLRQAQLIALQSQINPHFLYNTLESINWLVLRLTKGENEASRMLHSLSRLLRISLETEEMLVPLHKEIEHVRLYLDIQQRRYPNKFTVEWRIDEGTLDYKLLKITLQPILENAIYHGIKPSPHAGVLKIAAYEREQALIVTIRDNGVGILPQQLASMKDGLGKDDIKEDKHIGLHNIHQRIRLAFGEPYGLKLYSKPGTGTIVSVKLPRL
ncbi:cache domain-containing sensor histidine kinase [Paenibacillus cymbidii]|uniref:cache domain-containing sensor histidine kinase n=1 Tax=Paenibacillus cymbidii TaxID=1639034 RepID=UPI00107FFA97|nr:sensor histidine kinase [Paenibacillus cymbidii]